MTLFGSLQQLSRAMALIMALMFENWSSKEAIDKGYQSNTGTLAEINTDKLSDIEQSKGETLDESQERVREAMVGFEEPRSCDSDVSRAKIFRQAEGPLRI